MEEACLVAQKGVKGIGMMVSMISVNVNEQEVDMSWEDLVFFKMSHEVYNFGEGLVGKVAADNSHKWVFRDTPAEADPSFISSWNVSLDPQPRAWEVQFNLGIQTSEL